MPLRWPSMFEIGLSLREARTRQGLEFPEMEARTKVRAKYLRLLEEEQFDQLRTAQPTQPTVVAVRALHGASFVVVRYRRPTGRPLFSGTLERGDVQTFPQRLLWVSITSPRNVVVTVYGKRITIPKSGDFQLTVPRR